MAGDVKQQFITEFLVRGMANLDQAKDKIDQLNKGVNGLATALLGVSFVSFVSSALQSADAVSDFSDATNISISSIKAFGAALDESGGKAKNTERIINGFYAAIEAANGGSLAVRDAFKAVGVSLTDLGTLTETELLNKTLKGLSELPPGANRAAIATSLLTKAFRSVDPKNFMESIDPEKFRATEEATKQAAKRVQEMEAAFRTLQEGAIAAMEPILEMMGKTKLDTEAATKIVTGLGVAIGLAFGLSVVANILQVVKAVQAFNIASKAGIAIQAGLLALQGPKGWATLAGAAAATGAAIYGINKLLEDTTAQGTQAAESVKKVTEAAGVKPGTGLLEQAVPTSGNAKRRQELDARQKAELESNKRTAQSIADSDKEIALRGSSDLEKIDIEATASRARAREEIFSKENLSRQQKEKEYQAAASAIDTKAETDRQNLRRDLEAQVQQQRAGFATANAQLLGYEQTELGKVNDLIAQQPQKYKEIGDRLRENAQQQDTNLRFIKDHVKEQQRLNDLRKQLLDDNVSFVMSQIAQIDQTNLQKRLLFAQSEEQKIALREQYNYQQKIAGIEKSRLTDKVIAAGISDAEGDATAEQIQTLLDYSDGIKKVQKDEEFLRDQRVKDAVEILGIQRSFAYGWETAYADYIERSKNAAEQARGYFDTFARGFDNIFTSMTKGFPGVRDAIKSLINDLISQFLRLQAQQAFVALFGGPQSGSKISGTGGLLGSLFGSLFGGGSSGMAGAAVLGLPGFANGGSISANQLAMVGERGPELFLPRTAGTVIPNHMLGGGGNITTVNYNIQAVDASSFRSLVARDPEFIYSVTEAGRRSQPTRRLA
jgi:hypothetical protein